MNRYLITSQLEKEHPDIAINENQKIINPEFIEENIEFFKTIINYDIIIYDHTTNNKLENYTQMDICDHINRTGYNPIIGKQQQMPQDFIDISNLYKANDGVITNCLGKRFQKDYNKHDNPSHFICYIAILLQALGCKNIKGKLINIL